MRVAFFHLPVPGHVNPTLPVMAELRRRGAEVRAFATPSIADPIAASGATVVLYPPGLEERADPPPPGVPAVAALLAELCEQLVPFALEQLRSEPAHVVVCDSMAPWGRLAAEILGVPCVTSSAIFSVHAAMDRSPQAALEIARDTATGLGALRRLQGARRRVRRTHGVDPGNPLRIMSNRGDRTVVFTSRAFQPGADHFGDDVRFVGAPLRDPGPPDPLMDDLADEPLIYVSLGTLFNERAPFLRACLEAFADEPGRVLLSIGTRVDPATLGPLPANALIRASVPQLQVLQRTRLFVTHGGINSVSEALAYGVPMVLFPQTADQPLIARRVAALGAGRLLRGRDPSPEHIADTARAVLAGDAAARAEALGASLREGGGAPAAAEAILGVAP
ncbi:MAG: hypothetical protein JHC84_14150 [Solirubrobacteraceae bacterium]|nr:hypothetical protein [Solirubrobacteraceae bacterium]